MEVETREVENGVEIEVKTDEKVAVVVKGDEERIYLPGREGSDSTYYAESTSGLIETEEGYKAVHNGKVDDIEVLG